MTPKNSDKPAKPEKPKSPEAQRAVVKQPKPKDEPESTWKGGVDRFSERV